MLTNAKLGYLEDTEAPKCIKHFVKIKHNLFFFPSLHYIHTKLDALAGNKNFN